MFLGRFDVLILDPRFDVNLSVVLSVSSDCFHDYTDTLYEINEINEKSLAERVLGRIMLRKKYEKRVIQQTILLRVVPLCLVYLAL